MNVDESELVVLRVRAKQLLRSRMRAVRMALPEGAAALRSAKVCAHLLDLHEMSAARRVALFWPIARLREVDLGSASDALRARGVAVYYPFLREGDTPALGFAALDPGAAMVEGTGGFLEPPKTSEIARAGELDVIVCPALAVAATGHRLGYGSGFYDRLLGLHAPPTSKVVVAFEFQLLAELPVTDNDVRCDIVVTDERVLRA